MASLQSHTPSTLTKYSLDSINTHCTKRGDSCRANCSNYFKKINFFKKNNAADNPHLMIGHITTFWSYEGLRKGALQPIYHFGYCKTFCRAPPPLSLPPPIKWPHFRFLTADLHLWIVAASQSPVIATCNIFCHFPIGCAGFLNDQMVCLNDHYTNSHKIKTGPKFWAQFWVLRNNYQ